MPLALTGYELGLLIVALVFVAFALVVALVIPRSRPSFPGKRFGIFVGICILLFLAQMTAVLVLAGAAVPVVAALLIAGAVFALAMTMLTMDGDRRSELERRLTGFAGRGLLIPITV